MTNIILVGCNGKMGRVITALTEFDSECKIVAGVDVSDAIENSYPVYTDGEKCVEDADVIIDFSHPSALSGSIALAKRKKIPLIEATTGLTEEQKEELFSAQSEIPVFFSANMSLGINLLTALCKKATALLCDDFDIEIIEKHHNQKIDAPSGTALALADAISEVLDNPPSYVYDRHSVRKKRT